MSDDGENSTMTIPPYDYSSYYDDDANTFSPCSNTNLKDFSKIFLPTLYSLVFVVGIIGNGLVVCVLVKHRRQTNLTDICLFNLAVSDLVFVLTLPFYAHFSVLGQWPFGDFMCRFASGSHSTGFFSSIFFMVVMTLDRYMVIMHAHKVARYRTLRAGVALSALVWTLSLFVSLPAVLFTKVMNESNGLNCRYAPDNDAWRLYSIVTINALGLVVPLLVMIVCYSSIIPVLVNMRSAKKHRVVKLILSIVIAFFVFWAPYNICLFLKSLKLKAILSDCDAQAHLMLSIIVTETIAYTHCCLNPIIYAFVGQKFMRRVLQMLRKWVPVVLLHSTRDISDSSYRKSSVMSRSSDATSNFIMTSTSRTALGSTIQEIYSKIYAQQFIQLNLGKLILGVYLFFLFLFSFQKVGHVFFVVFPRKPTMATTVSAIVAFTGISESASTGNLTRSTTEFFSDSTNVTSTDYSYDYPEEGEGVICTYERHGAKFLPALYVMFFLLGLLGNSLVIWVIACGVRLRSMTDVCLLNLAAADLLLVCTLPFLAHQARDQWLFGDAMCKVVLGIYHIVFYCGIFFISLMSIDRYLAIVHAVYAMRARTRSFGMIAAAVTWVAGFLASFPDLVFLKQQPSGNMSQPCYSVYPKNFLNDTTSANEHFWTIFSLFKMNILGLFVPVFIMGFCYSQIIWRLLHSQSSKKQAIRLVLIVVAVFLCCWVPYNVASFFKALELLDIYTECESSKAIRLALQATEAIAYSHSCLNPILYVFVGQKFRRHLLRLMNRAPCRLCQLVKVYMPQDRNAASVYSLTTSLDERSTAV
ncbi:uncharacterized protein [Cebidichthys violaceus]|uniref:uncharacterized protein n=1 Tax=Cebidichthys violaceus TaxID=271503 RepID=UPI0035CBDE0B